MALVSECFILSIIYAESCSHSVTNRNFLVSVIMLNAVMLIVIMLNVVAPAASFRPLRVLAHCRSF